MMPNNRDTKHTSHGSDGKQRTDGITVDDVHVRIPDDSLYAPGIGEIWQHEPALAPHIFPQNGPSIPTQARVVACDERRDAYFRKPARQHPFFRTHENRSKPSPVEVLISR